MTSVHFELQKSLHSTGYNCMPAFSPNEIMTQQNSETISYADMSKDILSIIHSVLKDISVLKKVKFVRKNFLK